MGAKAAFNRVAVGVLVVALGHGVTSAQTPPSALEQSRADQTPDRTVHAPLSTGGLLPSGFSFRISMPENWNGILISDLDAIAPNGDRLGEFLLSNGYAYAGTGRHPDRLSKHDPLTELDAQVAVLRMVHASYGPPRRTVQLGCSGGGFVALAMAEKHAGMIDGAVAFNARGTGGIAVANTWLDLVFTLKALIAPNSDLKIAPAPGPDTSQALAAWMEALDKAQTPEGRARIALAVAVSQFPFWGAIGEDPVAKPDPSNLDVVEDAIVRSARDGVRNAVTRRQLYDNPAGLASWNTGVDYSTFYRNGTTSDQKRIITELYRRAGLGEAAIAADLRAINRQQRIGGTSEGVNYWLAPGRVLDGDIKIPVLQIHGLGDSLLPPHLLAGYAVEVAKRGKRALYRTGFIEATGHCSQSLGETKAAIDTLVERLDSGDWPDTTAAALNGRAKAAGDAKPRFVEHNFTPFNRAFHRGSAHPF